MFLLLKIAECKLDICIICALQILAEFHIVRNYLLFNPSNVSFRNDIPKISYRQYSLILIFKNILM